VLRITSGDSLMINGTISRTSGSIASDSSAVIKLGAATPAGVFAGDSVRTLVIAGYVSYPDTLTVTVSLHLTAADTLTGVKVIAVDAVTIDTLTGATPITAASAVITGPLTVTKIGAALGAQYTIVHAGSVTGAFASLGLPSGYGGALTYTDTTVVLTITGAPTAPNYRSVGYGRPVDLGTTANWLVYNGSAWVGATAAPATLTSGVIDIRTGDTWNNSSAVTIRPGVLLLDSGITGNFSNHILDSGTVVFCGATAQSIPAATAFNSQTMYGNVYVKNAAGVSSTGSSYLGIKGTLALTAGALTSGGGSFYLSGPVLQLGPGTGISSSTIVGFYGGTPQTIPDSLFTNQTVALLYIDNAAGVTLASNAAVQVSGNLNLQAGNFQLSAGDSLYLGGTISYTSGGITGGTVIFNGSASQTIPAGTFTSVSDIVIDNPAGVASSGALPATGRLVVDGHRLVYHAAGPR
jgi:hypothetical protein